MNTPVRYYNRLGHDGYRLMARVMLLTVICIAFSGLKAQHPFVVPVRPSDDYLPTNTFYVFRDNTDIMWIATNSGVYRYDGYNFKHFTSADGLGDNEILRIYQDEKGRIWFQPINGNPSYFLRGKIHNAQNDSLVAQLKFNKMLIAECEDAQGNLYLSGRGYVMYKIDAENNATAIQQNGLENFIWTGKDGNVHLVPKNKLPSRIIRGDSYGNLHLISNESFIYQIDDDSIFNKVFTMPQGSTEIIFMKIINNEEVYLGTRNGLYIWNRITNSTNYMMPGVSVSSAEIDFEGNIWVTTLQNGVFIIPDVRVTYYNSQYGLSEDRITTLEADDNKLWVGCANNKYAIIENGIVTFKGAIPSETPMDITNIRHMNDITYVIGKGNIVGISNRGRKEYNVYANDLLIYGDSVFLGQDNAMIFTKKEFETKLKDLIFNYPTRKRDYEVINARTNVFHKVNDITWIGTSRGLYTLSKSKLNFLGDAFPDCKYPIRDIADDPQHDFQYVATMNGLLVFHHGKQINNIGENSGLPNSDCNAIHIDAEGTIWAAFGNQLIAISRKAESFSFINYTQGFRLDPARITDVHTAQGRVYFATENGLLSFEKNISLSSVAQPKIIITSFVVNDIEKPRGRDIDLSWKENDITVFYSGLSYSSKNRIEYSYYLSGYDTSWHTTTDRSIQLKSLPPGKYQFLVKSANIAGVTSPVSSVTFTISRPVWGELWFILLSVLFLAGLIWMGWLLRLRAVKHAFATRQRTIQLEMEHAEAERKIGQLNQQVFRQQMNPHFIFNALNTIKGYYAENDIKKASDYISKFSKLLRNILENNEQWIPLEREINALTLYLDLAAMRYAYKFTYTIAAEAPVQSGITGIPPMLLQPFIENALVHGIAPKQGSGHINISFTSHDNRLVCIVEDDGIGRKASATRSRISDHNSKATQIINEYLQALNQRERAEAFVLDIQDLIDTAGKGVGTRIQLTMPLIILNP